ncbi:MAG: [FeFe] hydrogenase H-cluster radical SAM maturase HydE [Myxococcales bacterium]
MRREDLLGWLRQDDPTSLAELWRDADQVRRERVGDAVQLRGLIEVSNYCVRRCLYCGLRASAKLTRYRMTEEEILDCARAAVRFGYGTVVLQAGEDPALDRETVSAIVRRIKAQTPLAVTLSLGERTLDELAAWREAGADRYLLRFETSNPELFARIHPPLGRADAPSRIEILGQLRRLGYEVGSGVMIGIPGQSFEDLARDIELFAELDLDMIGVGPFIAHPSTPLGQSAPAADDQVPADELTTYKVLALARLVRPDANIPSTTALATLNLARGRELGLERGANVVMPNLTPVRYRALYEIYPGKACIRETADQCAGCLRRRIEAIGRTVGTGPGNAPSQARRRLEAQP